MSSALDLLLNGQVDEFNATRTRRASLDLFAADLSNLSLVGVDLSGANLQKADLSGTDLSSAVLVKTDLSGADLTGCNLSGTVALRSRWRDAYLGEADLSEADLTGADLSEADLTDAKLDNARLPGARLASAILVKASCNNVDFSEAKLSGADLQYANLTGAVLKEANLARANLSHATLTGADLTRARLSNASLRDANLSAARLTSADLTAADLSGATVSGADFTRADLTEAVVEGVDLSVAVLTEAELEGPAGTATPSSPEAGKIQIEDPSIAVQGDRVAILWENEDADGATRVRLIVGRFGEPFEGATQALDLPPDLVLARAVAPIPGGFAVIALVERPGGVVATLTTLDLYGRIAQTKSVKPGYTPAVRPVVSADDRSALIFGISREGPALHVHRFDGGELERVHLSGMATARGFAANLYPIVLSKGGVLILLGPNGVSQPMRAPSGFPGRFCAGAPLGDGLALAWIAQGAGGLNYATVRPGEAPDERRVLPKSSIGTLDLVSNAKGAWIAFTREDTRADSPASAWVVSVPDGTPEPVLADDDVDVDDVRFCVGGDRPILMVSTLDGEVRLYRIEDGGPRLVSENG